MVTRQWFSASFFLRGAHFCEFLLGDEVFAKWGILMKENFYIGEHFISVINDPHLEKELKINIRIFASPKSVPIHL